MLQNAIIGSANGLCHASPTTSPTRMGNVHSPVIFNVAASVLPMTMPRKLMGCGNSRDISKRSINCELYILGIINQMNVINVLPMMTTSNAAFGESIAKPMAVPIPITMNIGKLNTTWMIVSATRNNQNQSAASAAAEHR